MLFKLWVMLLHFISAEEIICSLFSENEDVKGLLGKCLNLNLFHSAILPSDTPHHLIQPCIH